MTNSTNEQLDKSIAIREAGTYTAVVAHAVNVLAPRARELKEARAEIARLKSEHETFASDVHDVVKNLRTENQQLRAALVQANETAEEFYRASDWAPHPGAFRDLATMRANLARWSK